MSGKKKDPEEKQFSLILQTRSNTDRVLMNSSDMKAINTKPGSSVAVYSSISNVYMVCRVWPSKTLTSGTISLNRIWWPNFGTDVKNRTAHVSKSTGRFD